MLTLLWAVLYAGLGGVASTRGGGRAARACSGGWVMRTVLRPYGMGGVLRQRLADARLRCAGALRSSENGGP